MTVEDLIAKFEELFEAPGAVAKIRAMVLNLAVQGKLVPQDPNDEPAHELLERLQSGLTPEQRRRQASPLPPIMPQSSRHKLPIGWTWSRFRDVAIIASNLVKPEEFLDFIHLAPDNVEKGNGVLLPCATVREDKVISSNHRFYAGQIIYSKIRPNLAKVVVVDFDGLCSADMYPIDALINKFYLFRYMLSDSFLMQAVKTETRVAMPKINQMELNAIAVSVPPLAEQKRIVAKVDELMALCDQLEAQQKEREDRKSTLTRAALSRFNNNPTPNNLQYLFHPSYDITTADLRKTILTLAVQGKLTSQTSTDGHVIVCEAEKKTLREKWEKPICENELPFDIPSTWKWSRLGNVSSLKHGYAFSSNFFTSTPTQYVLMTPGNFYERGGFRDRESKRKYFSGPVDKSFVLKPDDLIIPMTEQAAGLLGSPAFIPDDGRTYIHNQRLGKISFTQSVSAMYGFWFFNSEFFRGELARTCTGMKVRHTSPDRVLRVPIPIPPLAEQRRIVAKVNQLMALVDELETQLAAADKTAKDLLDAVVHELISSTASTTREMETVA